MNHSFNPLSMSAHATSRRQLIAVAGAAIGGVALCPLRILAEESDGLSRSAEAIHQEPVFEARRQVVYRALTDAKQFDQIVLLSGVTQSMGSGAKPTELSPEPGSAFTLFGGYIVGRQIELVRDTRIVQAWRALSWKPGEYSIASFHLLDAASKSNMGTKIVFDQRGFPAGTGEHLATGWKAHYWEPLAKLLTQNGS
ncbi:MAG TPA: SRPBCC domain-containing protein [Candidatus Cybelea sp.]|nr:SRPBCC domain-containing protein [Candidatus Cybelea sp.]